MKGCRRIILFLLLVPLFLQSAKIELKKKIDDVRTPIRIHELERHFGKSPGRQSLNSIRDENDNRLLVMLVDFEEDSTSTTTGNGKFKFSDPEYLLDLGKPPHDQEYFWWVMESVRYYYQAASLGCYNLEFDIYPQAEYSETDTTIIAYTLPNQMSYYNPPGADTDLMISRFEEYFHDVFTTVDADEEVDFSQYGHYMIIHAGSDYQHDINGDSQGDIPSFFIRVGDGKEVVVDDGIVINKACNVPETISQDGQYGVTTAVTAHEFGHSLGFIDLYSTLTGSPQVGWFDIMDSGGMGELIVDEIDGEYITIEGGLPTLPNAWHRILAWEDNFRERGILKDINELDWDELIRIEPAEKLTGDFNSPHPYFIKVPLTDTEYLLIENRQVDPDGDSGLSFKGALPQYPYEPFNKGYRILLYPTYPGNIASDAPNWEYDLFIPGWQNESDDGIIYNYGGGLVIWHIDDRIIYEEGSWEDGEFYSNYDQNTVNALHSQRGIRVIEADGFDDIGNYDDGYNIMGSAYDPFYRFYPRISEGGNFLGWDNQGISPGYQPVNEDEFIHTIEFNGSSFPKLQTNSGDPAFFGLWNISSYSTDVGIERYMSFRYGSHLFDKIEILGEYEGINNLSEVTEVLGINTFWLIKSDEIEAISLLGEGWSNHLDLRMPYNHDLTQPITNIDIDNDGIEETILISDSLMSVVDGIDYYEEEFSNNFSDAPMIIERDEFIRIYALDDRMLINDEAIMIPGAKISYDGEYLLAANQDNFWYINPQTREIEKHYTLPYSEQAYYPIAFKSLVDQKKMNFQVLSSGEIWKINLEKKEKIFDCSYYTASAPTQLMISSFTESGRTWLMFAAGEYLFAITETGTMAEGYPVYMEDNKIEVESWLKTLKLNDRYLSILQKENGSQLAINENGELIIDFTGINTGNNRLSHYWYDAEFEEFNWFGLEGDGKLLKGTIENIKDNPLITKGYRNERYNFYEGYNVADPDTTAMFSAYAFPNPARKDYAVVRVFQATDELQLKLYDIAGNQVLAKVTSLEANPYQDIRLDISGISSGVYYACIKSGSKTLTVPLGIEK